MRNQVPPYRDEALATKPAALSPAARAFSLMGIPPLSKLLRSLIYKVRVTTLCALHGYCACPVLKVPQNYQLYVPSELFTSSIDYLLKKKYYQRNVYFIVTKYITTHFTPYRDVIDYDGLTYE